MYILYNRKILNPFTLNLKGQTTNPTASSNANVKGSLLLDPSAVQAVFWRCQAASPGVAVLHGLAPPSKKKSQHCEKTLGASRTTKEQEERKQ